jgi:hypothetical protein
MSGKKAPQISAEPQGKGLIPKSRLAAMASCSITEMAGRLRAGLEMSVGVVGPGAVVLPALVAHLRRAAVVVLLLG